MKKFFLSFLEGYQARTRFVQAYFDCVYNTPMYMKNEEYLTNFTFCS